MALCENHCWVIDIRLIASGPDMQRHVSMRLDDHIEGQRRLVEFKGKGILLPRDRKLQPHAPALAWRVKRLMGVN